MTRKDQLLEMWATSRVGLYAADMDFVPKIEFAHDDKELLEECRRIWGGGITLGDERGNALTKLRGKYVWHMFGGLSLAFAEDILPLLEKHDKLKHKYCKEIIDWYEDHRHVASE